MSTTRTRPRRSAARAAQAQTRLPAAALALVCGAAIAAVALVVAPGVGPAGVLAAVVGVVALCGHGVARLTGARRRRRAPRGLRVARRSGLSLTGPSCRSAATDLACAASKCRYQV